MAYGLLKTSSTTHDKIESQQVLLLLDKYSKKPMAVSQSEGTVFVQKDMKGKSKKTDTTTDPKKVEFDKKFYKDKECFRCGKKGHPKAACTVKMVAADDNKITKTSSSKISSMTGASGNVGKCLRRSTKHSRLWGRP